MPEDQPAQRPVSRPMDATVGDSGTLVAMGVIEAPPVPSPDPPPPPSYDGYDGPIIETA